MCVTGPDRLESPDWVKKCAGIEAAFLERIPSSSAREVKGKARPREYE
jgi:hypothetical protein